MNKKILRIIELRDKWKKSRNERCQCSGFQLNYNRHCTCRRKMHREKAKAKLMKFIMDL